MKKIHLTVLYTSLVALFSTPLLAGETTNRIGITMVDIPAGSFVMGSCPSTSDKDRFMGEKASCVNQDSQAKSDEVPQHRVKIRAFQLGKTEVTLEQFKKFIAAADRKDLVTDDFMSSNGRGDNAPVTMVSWDDALAFINWLNKVDGGGYRLPSESEWEYACRAGGDDTYCGSGVVDAVAWTGRNSNLGVSQVGAKQANAFGLYDMSGNVWEWVADCWHGSYRGAPGDGSAWTSGCLGVQRVLRGGAWSYYSTESRAAYRNFSLPGRRNFDIGLRLARTR